MTWLDGDVRVGPGDFCVTTKKQSTRASAAKTRVQPAMAKPHKLDEIGSLDDFIPYKLSVVANRISQSIGRLFETQFNLQVPEWRILMALYAYGTLSFNEVVERTSMDKARVSRAQRRLVDLKMITVQSDPNDGRRIFLTITRDGAKICKNVLPEAARTQAWFLEGLTDAEQVQLDTILNKLMARSQLLIGTNAPFQK
jgi:DNA-binding MarR family transcriptional regulator